MILTRNAIKEAVHQGEIIIDPCDPHEFGTVSYRFRTAGRILSIEGPIDSAMPVEYVEHEIPEEGFVLHPGVLYLANTYETLGSDKYAQQIYGIRDFGCMGVFLNVSADLGHIGAKTKWTLEMTVDRAVRLYPLQRIGQIVFWCLDGDATPYDGYYQRRDDPMPSQLWREKGLL